MKGWIMAALLVTFASGISTGLLIGRSQEPSDRPPTWKDKYVEQLQRTGVTGEKDLDRARKILDGYEKRAQALKIQLPRHLRDQLRRIGAEAQQQIQEIIDKYRTPTSAPR